ncbi:DUF5999 family protein [Streptomyces sp. NPDC060235]|uniref:DUF5999 family protein n=1 Tax=Streptomyces sp. NPDC060235 TaxID=3347080 RepID=UPI003656D263
MRIAPTPSAFRRQPPSLCRHTPACPAADSSDAEGARVVAGQPEQGWSLLCNGVFVFADTGELLPDGRIVAPHRPAFATH